MHSDQGKNLNAEVITALFKKWGIKRSSTVTYHPQGNGITERSNRTIQDIIAKKIQDGQADRWDELLPHASFAHNGTPNAESGFSPAILFLGRELCLPLKPEEFQAGPTSENAVFKAIHELLQKHNQDRQNFQEKQPFGVGDRVLLQRPRCLPGAPKKFASPWEGPFTVVALRRWLNYIIKDNTGRQRTVHVSQLKKWIPPVDSPVAPANGSGPSPANSSDAATPRSNLEPERQNERYAFRPRVFQPRRIQDA